MKRIMNKPVLCFLVLIISFSILIPAYAEVTSLKTNSAFYKGGSKIYFSGTILDTDASTVTVLIFDPNGQYTRIAASGFANSTHQFQIMVDTSAIDNQQKLSLKGIYNATAFVAQKENGKTVSFAFSPDGSPLLASPPTSLVASAPSSTEIDLSWSMGENNAGSSISGYKIERNDGSGFNTIQNTQTTYFSDLGLVPHQQYSYRVSAINSAGTSAPSNVVNATTLSSPNVPANPIPNNSTAPSLDELLQQRMKDAQKLQELLHGSHSSGSSQSPPAGISHTIGLTEHVNLNDLSDAIPTGSISKSNPTQIPNIAINNILYPLISIVGVGIVVTILYFRKKRKTKDDEMNPEISSVTAKESDEDYPILIIKNRLAKGEITMEEFKLLKDELSES